jgi:hypothetical protein
MRFSPLTEGKSKERGTEVVAEVGVVEAQVVPETQTESHYSVSVFGTTS